MMYDSSREGAAQPVAPGNLFLNRSVVPAPIDEVEVNNRHASSSVRDDQRRIALNQTVQLDGMRACGFSLRQMCRSTGLAI